MRLGRWHEQLNPDNSSAGDTMAKAKPSANMNKRQMVQAAVEAKGDVPARELQAYISATYGAELTIGIVSNYKSVLKKQTGKATVKLAELEAVSQLVRKLGVEKVLSLVNIVKTLTK